MTKLRAARQPNNLRAIREAKGLSQAQLAKLLGIDQANVSRYESGQQAFYLDTAILVATTLGISVEELGVEPRRVATAGDEVEVPVHD